MNSLGYDTCRCKGLECGIRTTCLRYIVLFDEDIPEYARIAVCGSLCLNKEGGKYAYYIGIKTAGELIGDYNEH